MEPILASPKDRIKTGVRQCMVERYPEARFAWFEPPIVDEPLRIGVEYKFQRHYVALTDELIERPDEAIRITCDQIQALIGRDQFARSNK